MKSVASAERKPLAAPGLWLMALAVSSFSLASICIKLLGPEIPSHEKILVRSLGTLPVVLWLLLRRRISPLGVRRGVLLARGALGFLATACYFIALTRMPLGNAVLISYSSPLFAAWFASLFLSEPAGRRVWIASLFCMLGVLLVARPTPAAPIAASLIALASAILNGATYTIIRSATRHDHPLVIVLALPAVALPVTLVMSIFEWVAPTPRQWALLLVMTVLSIVGQVLMTLAFRRESAARVSNLFFLGVVIAVLVGPLLGDPLPSVTDGIGALMVIGGILYLATRRVVEPRPGGRSP